MFPFPREHHLPPVDFAGTKLGKAINSLVEHLLLLVEPPLKDIKVAFLQSSHHLLNWKWEQDMIGHQQADPRQEQDWKKQPIEELWSYDQTSDLHLFWMTFGLLEHLIPQQHPKRWDTTFQGSFWEHEKTQWEVGRSNLLSHTCHGNPNITNHWGKAMSIHKTPCDFWQ